MRAIDSVASKPRSFWAGERPRLRATLSYVPAAVAALGILIIAVIANGLNNDAFQKNLHLTVSDRLSLVRARLEGNITACAQLVRGLVGVIAVEPDLSREKFNRLAAQIVGDKSPIRNVGAAPDLVIRYMYPLEGNEAAVGLDYRTAPDQREAALRALDTGELVLAGPIDLVQGGRGLVARFPVFVPSNDGGAGRFWGLVSTVIDLDRLYAESGMLDPDVPVEFAIRGKDATGAEGAVFYGRPEIFQSAPILADVVLPSGTWQIAAIPKGGWPTRPDNTRYLQTGFWLAGILVVLPLVAVGTLMRQRRRAENDLVRALREVQDKSHAAEISEAKFAAAFEQSPLVATIARLDTGAILDVNDAFLRLTGIERDDAIGRNSAELKLFTPEQRDQFRRTLLQEGQVAGMDVQVELRNGRTIDAVVYSRLFNVEDTKYLLTLVEDITERKRADEAIRSAKEAADAAQARLKSAIETVADGFALFDADDRLVMANSRYLRFLESVGDPLAPGMTFEATIRKGAEHGLYKDAIGRVEEWIAERLAAHRSADLVIEQELANGTWLRIVERRMPDGGIASFGIDITEMKQREEELKQARILADAANQAKSTFLSSMSHELRTPMNAILGFAQLLERNPKVPAGDKQRQYARHILNAGQYLLELIDQVLELSKIEAGKLNVVNEQVDVREVVAHSIFMVAGRAKPNGITLVNQTEGLSLPRIWSDRGRLRQILLNLLSNAIKYNRKGGEVRVTAAVLDSGMLRIGVEDTGVGIASEHHEQVFEPFNRLGREADGSEGSGIGLAITKQIVELLGGSIGFTSDAAQGSVFWVDLPIGMPAGSSAKEPEETEAGPGSPASETSKRCILYVEDNSSNLRLMEELIGTTPNLAMLSAPSGTLALEIAREHRPDLILLDINLPEMDGFEVLKRLQSAPETRNIPVIAVTAAAMPHEVEKGLEAGFREYITKPIDIAAILLAIDRNLG